MGEHYIGIFYVTCIVFQRANKILIRLCTIVTSRKHAYIILTPLNQFYIVKLGFTRVYIIFLIFAQKHRLWYSLESPRRGGSNEYPQSMFWAEIWKLSEFFIWKFSVLGGEIFYIFEQACFRNELIWAIAVPTSLTLLFSWWAQMCRNLRRRIFLHVCPTKTQISLRIRLVWPDSSLSRSLIWIFADSTHPMLCFLTMREMYFSEIDRNWHNSAEIK